ncbi:MAG TPA: NAD-dependent dehydratase [Armatimonadetes bacterium]|nr:NAD-dependent dehydratase [Armatimonadota bacterium]
MERVLITGGAGFLGSHLCDFLLSRGYQVTAMDNLITGTTQNIVHHQKNPRFTFIKYDVTEYLYLKERIDYLFHFASPASPMDYLKYPIQTLKVGSLGTHKTLGLAAREKSVYVLASTSEVYGDPLIHPQTEEYWGNVNPVGPRGVYDEAKRFAEAMATAYRKEHGVDTKIVRIFNTYGPRMRAGDGRVVPTLICQAIKDEPLTIQGDGRQTRSFCYVSDLIEGIYRLAVSGEQGPINMGNPEEFTILDFAKLVIKLSGSRSRIQFHPAAEDDPRRRKPDISKAEQLLEWRPKVPLEEGLADTIKWYKTLCNNT